MDFVTDQTVDVTPMVEGFMEDFNGVPFPQFFGNKQAYKTISYWDRLNWLFKLIGSSLWVATNFNAITVLLERFSGKYSELGFFKRIIWMWYRFTGLNYDSLVVSRNFEFILFKGMAGTAASLWFRVFFLWNLFLRITAGFMFNADFDELDE